MLAIADDERERVRLLIVTVSSDCEKVLYMIQSDIQDRSDKLVSKYNEMLAQVFKAKNVFA